MSAAACVCECVFVRGWGHGGLLHVHALSSRPLGSSCVTAVSCGSLLPRCRRSNSPFRLAWKDEVRLAHEQTSMSSRELKIKTGRRGNKGKCGEKYLNFEGCETYFFFSPRYKACSVDSNITGATWLDRIWACSLCTRLTESMNPKSDLWGFSDGAVIEVVMQARTLTTYEMKQPSWCIH